MTNSRTASALALGALVLLSGCGQSSRTADSPTAQPAAILNSASVNDFVSAIKSANLPLPNWRDVTVDACPKIKCAQALTSDTVSIYKFAHTGQAQLYAGSVQQSFQLEDTVLVFAATVPSDQRVAYEQAVQRAIG